MRSCRFLPVQFSVLFNAENKNHQERFRLFGIMPRLSDLDRGRAIELLDSGLGIKAVSKFLHVTPKIISKKYQ